MAGLGDRLTKARDATGMTQVLAAHRLRMGRETLSNYERGTRPPSLANLVRMSDLYGVSERWLLRGEGQSVEQDTQLDSVALSILREMSPELQRALMMDWWPRLNELYREMRHMEELISPLYTRWTEPPRRVAE